MTNKYTIRRSFKDFSNATMHVIEAMCFNRKRVILDGSASYRIMQFPADYDLYEVVDMHNKNVVNAYQYVDKRFKEIIKKLMNMPDVYIGDIKFGVKNDEPIRWTPKQILQKSLIGHISGMCKLDVIAYLDNIYTDLSIIYEFRNNGKLLNEIQTDKQAGLQADVMEYYKEGNYYKCAKRILSLALFKKNKGIIDKLIKLFNSNAGLMYQVISNIQTLIFMFENYDDLGVDKIDSELDTMINRMSKIYDIHAYLRDSDAVVKLIKKIIAIPNSESHYKEYARGLTKLYDHLYDILQATTKKYMYNEHIFPLKNK